MNGLLLSAALLMSSPAPPAPPSLRPVSDAVLADNRGGLALPDGQELQFSALVSSYLDGRLMLQSRLTWTDQGAVVETGAADAVGAAGAGAAAGQTVFIHDLANGAIANLLLNTDSQRDLRLETAITLGLPGFDAAQTAMREALAARAVAADVRSGLAASY